MWVVVYTTPDGERERRFPGGDAGRRDAQCFYHGRVRRQQVPTSLSHGTRLVASVSSVHRPRLVIPQAAPGDTTAAPGDTTRRIT